MSLATPGSNLHTQENRSISLQYPEAGPALAFLQPHPTLRRAGEAGALGWGKQALGHSWNVSFNRTSGQRQAGECAGGSQPSAVQVCLRGGGQGFPGGQNAKAKRPKPNGPSLSPVWLTFKQKLRYLKEIVSLQE